MGDDMRRMRQPAFPFVGGLALLTATAGMAEAQSASGSLSAFNRSGSSLESPVNVSTRDANGNMTLVNGVLQAPEGSIFANLAGVGSGSSSSTGSISSSASGSGGVGSATAIGNNLNVTVSGNYNTVIVNASQTNTGAISAVTTLNGKVNLDDAQ